MLAAFGLLALVLMVFGAGMAAASLQRDNGPLDWVARVWEFEAR